MKIADFTLPALLVSHLKSDGRKLSDNELMRLKALLTLIDSPAPRLWRHEQIVSQHKLWSTEAAASYLGTESKEFFPGRIDAERVLIIGEADEDSPIALDYRTDEPRVVYLGGVGPLLVWIELKKDPGILRTRSAQSCLPARRCSGALGRQRNPLRSLRDVIRGVTHFAVFGTSPTAGYRESDYERTKSL
jgi:hypothetical protein